MSEYETRTNILSLTFIKNSKSGVTFDKKLILVLLYYYLTSWSFPIYLEKKLIFEKYGSFMVQSFGFEACDFSVIFFTVVNSSSRVIFTTN